MSTCKDCKYWERNPDSPHEEDLLDCCDPITWEVIPQPFEVKVCKHPKLRFFERPMEKDGFAIADGSNYRVLLATAEDFGCNQFTSKE